VTFEASLHWTGGTTKAASNIVLLDNLGSAERTLIVIFEPFDCTLFVEYAIALIRLRPADGITLLISVEANGAFAFPTTKRSYAGCCRPVRACNHIAILVHVASYRSCHALRMFSTDLTRSGLAIVLLHKCLLISSTPWRLSFSVLGGADG
jgi:hypothetical protein